MKRFNFVLKKSKRKICFRCDFRWNLKKLNILIKKAKKNNQLLITPHIGGMTVEAQKCIQRCGNF